MSCCLPRARVCKLIWVWFLCSVWQDSLNTQPFTSNPVRKYWARWFLQVSLALVSQLKPYSIPLHLISFHSVKYLKELMKKLSFPSIRSKQSLIGIPGSRASRIFDIGPWLSLSKSYDWLCYLKPPRYLLHTHLSASNRDLSPGEAEMLGCFCLWKCSEWNATSGSQNSVKDKNCGNCVVMDNPALWRNKTAILNFYLM